MAPPEPALSPDERAAKMAAIEAEANARAAERIAERQARFAGQKLDAEAARKRFERLAARARSQEAAAGQPTPVAPGDSGPTFAPAPLPDAGSAAPASAPAAPPAPGPKPAVVLERTGEAAESLPYAPVPDEPTLGDLVRIASGCANPIQRAELILQALARGVKDVQLLKLLRGHANHPHPAVRAAANEGLSILFGAAWSARRDIPPPVQPPRSDD
jgi:hypothetical protein